METKKRVFDIYGVGDYKGKKIKFKKGRYVTRDPAGSAKKAFNQIIKLNNITSGSLVIAVQERTRNSDNKIKIYTVERFKLQTPKVFKKDTSDEYSIQYDTKILTNRSFKLEDLNKDYEIIEKKDDDEDKDKDKDDNKDKNKD